MTTGIISKTQATLVELNWSDFSSKITLKPPKTSSVKAAGTLGNMKAVKGHPGYDPMSLNHQPKFTGGVQNETHHEPAHPKPCQSAMRAITGCTPQV